MPFPFDPYLWTFLLTVFPLLSPQLFYRLSVLSPIYSFYVLFVFIGHVFWKSVNIDLLGGGNAIAFSLCPGRQKVKFGRTRNGTNVNGSWNHWVWDTGE